ncbi:MAG: hypothetical protein NTX57_19660 [Armatimonadetes bacterium]|nr:hypothetical protein [Armatimonadota bacterium]
MKKFSIFVTLLVGLLLVGCQPDADKAMSKQEEDNMRKPLGQPMPPEAAAAMQKANAGPPPGAQAPR